MIRVAIAYPRLEGKFFDLDYYIDHHMNLVLNKLKSFGLQAIEVEGGINGTTPFFAIGSLLFETQEQYEAGFAEAGQELLKDIPNYTNSNPVVQVSHYHKLA